MFICFMNVNHVEYEGLRGVITVNMKWIKDEVLFFLYSKRLTMYNE